jgi:hypothetical protein
MARFPEAERRKLHKMICMQFLSPPQWAPVRLKLGAHHALRIQVVTSA